MKNILKNIKLALVAMLFAFISTGCSVAQYVKESPTSAYVVVKVATAKVVKGEEGRALEVIEKVAVARKFVSMSAEVSISNMVEEVKSHIGWESMLVEDRILIELILAEAEEKLKARIGDGVLTHEQRLNVHTVLDWIEASAKVYIK